MKRGTPDHWKMKDLARRLNVPPMYAIAWANGVMERIWHYTAKYCPQGDIGRVPDEEIAEVCGWPVKAAGRLVEALVQSRWLDRSSAHRLLVHDWQEHADQSVKKTLANRGLSFFFPEKSGNIPEDSTLTRAVPLPLPEPMPEPEPKPRGAAEKLADTRLFPHRGVDEIFEDMYATHPKKGDRGIAERYLAESVSAGADLNEIVRVHGQYCQSEWAGNDGKFAPKLAQWLLDKGWKYPPKVREPGQAAGQKSSKFAALDAWADS